MAEEYTDEQLENMSDEEFDKYYEETMASFESNETTQTSENSEEQTEEVVDTEPNNESQESVAEESSVEEPTEESTKEEADTQAELSKVYKFKADGQEYEATLSDLINKFAPQAVNYTKKTQKIAEYMPYVEAMKAKGVTPQNVNLLIDLVSGDENRAKGLLKNLIKQYKIDPMDLELEEEEGENAQAWSPVDYAVDIQDRMNKESFNESINRMKQEPELFLQTNSVVENLDNESKSFLYTTPGALEGLQKDIKEGKYARIMPLANQIALNDGFRSPVMKYYLDAANYIGQQDMQQARERNMQLARQQETVNTQKAKCAIPGQRVQTPKRVEAAEDDIWNMSDADFENFTLKK